MNLVLLFVFSAVILSAINLALTSIATFQHRNLKAAVVGFFVCLLMIYQEHLVEFAGYSCALPFTIYSSAPFYLLLIPFLNLVIKATFNQSFNGKKFVIEVLPAIVYLFLMIPFYLSTNEHKCNYLTEFVHEGRSGSYKHLVLVSILLIQTVAYSIIWYRRIFPYTRVARSKTSSSNIEFIPWVSRLLILIMAFTFSIIITWIARLLTTGNYYTLDQIGNVVLSLIPMVFIFLLFFLPDKPFPKVIDSSKNEDNDQSFDPALVAKLEHLMKTESLFLNADLSLSDVAIKMGQSRHEITHLLTYGLKKNFYDCVNEYRIFYAKSLMKSDTVNTYSLSGIATESGFNSYVSFYRVFKRLTGMTPSKYLEQK